MASFYMAAAMENRVNLALIDAFTDDNYQVSHPDWSRGWPLHLLVESVKLTGEWSSPMHYTQVRGWRDPEEETCSGLAVVQMKESHWRCDILTSRRIVSWCTRSVDDPER
eukprot:5846102-Prymnesium_polylepis.2